MATASRSAFPLISFHRLCSAHQMSFLRLISSAHRILPSQRPSMARLEARAHLLHPLLHCHRPCWRPQAKIRSKAHRAARSEDIPSRLSLPASVSDHKATAAPRSSYVLHFIRRPMYRDTTIASHRRELSDHQRSSFKISAALCRLLHTL